MEEIIDNKNQEIQAPMRPIAIKWGLFITFYYIIYSLVNLMMNDWVYKPDTSAITMILNLIVPLTLMYLGTVEYRKQNNDVLLFGKAFKFNYLVSFISVVIFCVYLLVFYNFIIDFDEYVASQIADTYKKLESSGKTKEEINIALKYTKMFIDNQFLSIGAFAISMLLFNLLYSLIIAAITQKK